MIRYAYHIWQFLRPNAEAIDAAITSKTFWCTLKAVNELTQQCELIGRWSEGCPCHESILTDFASQQARLCFPNQWQWVSYMTDYWNWNQHRLAGRTTHIIWKTSCSQGDWHYITWFGTSLYVSNEVLSCPRISSRKAFGSTAGQIDSLLSITVISLPLFCFFFIHFNQWPNSHHTNLWLQNEIVWGSAHNLSLYNSLQNL